MKFKNKWTERGLGLTAVILSVGGLVGMAAVAIVAMTGAAGSQANRLKAMALLRASQHGQVCQATALLAERLQRADLPPVTATDLEQMLPGTPIEDEGGKVSLPMNVHALPSVLKVFGVDEMDQPLADLAEIWDLSYVTTPYLSYPMLAPSATPISYVRFESPGDLAGFLGLSRREAEKVSRWFTPCETTGVNVNTADRQCVEGLLAWQRGAAKGWTDRAAEANTPGGHIHIWPLPSQDSVVKASPRQKPSEALQTTLPVSLYAVDPSPGKSYDPLWQLVRVAISNAPFQVLWMDHLFPHKKATFESDIVDLDKKYSNIPSYAVRPNAWLKFQSVPDADAMVGGRPYAVNEVTQPLGLYWFTPESYFTPINPSALGQFEVQNPVPPIALNVGLSAAAFTGWVSLQGPGPYRPASEWYTFAPRDTVGGSEVVTRVTLRVYPNEMPVVLMASAEEE